MDNPFVSLLDLDTDPQYLIALRARHDWDRVRAIERLCEVLEESDAQLAGDIRIVVEAAPQVLTTAAAWQWAVDSLAWLRTPSRRTATELRAAFSRFVVDAAVASQKDAEVDVVAGQDERTLVLPYSKLVLRVPRGKKLAVAAGVVSAETVALPTVDRTSIDPYDRSLRKRGEGLTPREVDLNTLDTLADELRRELELASTIAPSLASGLRTRLLPVEGDDSMANAATHEGMPGATFMSFDRSRGDLLAALAHEEAHQILNSATSLGLLRLPTGDQVRLKVPWKPQSRPLPAVLHGVAAFSRAGLVHGRVAEALEEPLASQRYEQHLSWVESALEILRPVHHLLSSEVIEWLEDVPGGMRELASPELKASLDLNEPVATSGRASNFSWWLFGNEALRILSLRSYDELSDAGSWSRSVSDFYTQDELVDVPAGAEASLALTRWLRTAGTDLVTRLLGTAVVSSRVNFHRLRRHDRIGAHTDEEGEADARILVGLTPSSVADGGSLVLWSRNQSAAIEVPSVAGSQVAFEIGPASYHAVSAVRSGVPRMTAVGSYVMQ